MLTIDGGGLSAANHPPDLATDAMAYFLRMRQQA